ncbi:MAG TPA: cyanophycin synthetase [Syntrophomonadaceae bacterium]|nr:cyanophycin synthetase [Syntrophomonadaceae bacterium]
MKIINIRNYRGRNIFSHKPVVKMMVDLGDLTEKKTTELEGFNEKLLEWFPGLETHCCSTGYEGGFVERLYEGTLVSHVTEHLALELQCIMGYDVYFGKTRIAEEPSLYCIVYEYLNEYCATDFGRTAVEIISTLARNEFVPFNDIMDRLQRIVSQSDLGPSTKAIFDEAVRRHIPVRRLDKDSLLQLGYGKHLRCIQASLLDNTSCIAVDVAKNKQLAKDILSEYNIPVPEGVVVDSEDAAVLIADQFGYPIAIKPYDANQGKGVTTNIGDEELLRAAYRFANAYTNRVIVEKHVQGKDYRILVVGDQVSAAAERRPPYVIGDGIHSIVELIAQENRNPQRGIGHEKPLSKIRFDSVARELLRRSGRTEYSIPEVEELIYLRENGNLSTGGSARDCTMEVHPFNKALAVKAAKAINLEIAGIDIVMDDISQPLTPLNGAVIEVNAAPGLRMHLYPKEGEARNVAADILDYMYPKETPFSIPIVSITGTNGKTTVTRMIRHVLSLFGKKVGMTCSSGTYIGDECISEGDNTGPVSAYSVLYNREIEAAVLETARGGIIRKGLGYDLADVGIIINISEDHLGVDGVYTLEDLAFAKSLVVEAVKPEGYAILNADDNMTEYIAQGIRCNLIYFAQNRSNPMIEQHIRHGGTAVVVENEQLMLYRNNQKIMVLSIQDIPITFGGKVLCNIENSLAAVSCLFALGLPEEIIKFGMMTFKPDPFINAGRFNLFDLGEFQVLLDYGHNPSGYQSVIQFIKSLDVSRLVGVIGMPGDRLDNSIYYVGQICGQVFSKIYIKEDDDLRGRSPGEVAGLLYEGALSGGAHKENIEIIISEIDALETAIYNAFPGDLIVMFYESFETAFALIDKYMKEPIKLIPWLSYEESQVPIVPLYLPLQSIQEGAQGNCESSEIEGLH